MFAFIATSMSWESEVGITTGYVMDGWGSIRGRAMSTRGSFSGDNPAGA
jgi:hypothetical protein